jgi:hypothetical protein
MIVWSASMRCRRRQLVGLVLLLGFDLATSGCSLMFVDGPPPRPRRPDFDCSSNYAMPTLDTGLALLGLAFAAIGRSGASSSLSSHELPLLAVSATFLFSGVDGYQEVYACREALEEAAPPPETPHHHRPPPSRPAPAVVTTPSAPPAPPETDPSDALGNRTGADAGAGQ